MRPSPATITAVSHARASASLRGGAFRLRPPTRAERPAGPARIRRLRVNPPRNLSNLCRCTSAPPPEHRREPPQSGLHGSRCRGLRPMLELGPQTGGRKSPSPATRAASIPAHRRPRSPHPTGRKTAFLSASRVRRRGLAAPVRANRSCVGIQPPVAGRQPPSEVACNETLQPRIVFRRSTLRWRSPK